MICGGDHRALVLCEWDHQGAAETKNIPDCGQIDKLKTRFALNGSIIMSASQDCALSNLQVPSSIFVLAEN